MRGLSLVAASGGHSSSQCAGLSLLRPLLLRSTSSRCAGSVVVAHTPSCSVAFGIFPDQGSNPCPLHWQADSQPLRHQGSPDCLFFITAWFHILWMQYFLSLNILICIFNILFSPCTINIPSEISCSVFFLCCYSLNFVKIHLIDPWFSICSYEWGTTLIHISR